VAEHLAERWEPTWDAPTRRDRRGGTYHPYVPDPLVPRSLTLTPHTAERIARAETLVRSLSNNSEGRGLEHLARFLLRSEAIASSRIEGLQVSPQQVALAELATTEQHVRTGFSATAKLVANNVVVLRQAVNELVAAPTITTADVVALHRALLPDERHHGLRSVQNWIGGGDWHPLDAEFVPPPPARVPSLMDDLATYTTGAAHAPLVQAALVHAQFETLHPFTDGNGRVGRALIHTVLTRRGLTSATVLPISLVFFTRSADYIRGLTAFRHISRPDGPDADEAFDAWLTVFIDATELAVEQAERFATEIGELRTEWSQRLAAHRSGQGLRAEPRADSAVARLLRALPETPVLTANTVQRLLGVSHPAARAALEELAEAPILSRKQVDRGATGYLARDVFDLLTLTERRLASTRWDTRKAAPNRAVPASPQPK
jgi:Fic family protein